MSKTCQYQNCSWKYQNIRQDFRVGLSILGHFQPLLILARDLQTACQESFGRWILILTMFSIMSSEMITSEKTRYCSVKLPGDFIMANGRNKFI